MKKKFIRRSFSKVTSHSHHEKLHQVGCGSAKAKLRRRVSCLRAGGATSVGEIAREGLP